MSTKDPQPQNETATEGQEPGTTEYEQGGPTLPEAGTLPPEAGTLPPVELSDDQASKHQVMSQTANEQNAEGHAAKVALFTARIERGLKLVRNADRSSVTEEVYLQRHIFPVLGAAADTVRRAAKGEGTNALHETAKRAADALDFPPRFHDAAQAEVSDAAWELYKLIYPLATGHTTVVDCAKVLVAAWECIAVAQEKQRIKDATLMEQGPVVLAPPALWSALTNVTQSWLRPELQGPENGAAEELNEETLAAVDSVAYAIIEVGLYHRGGRVPRPVRVGQAGVTTSVLSREEFTLLASTEKQPFNAVQPSTRNMSRLVRWYRTEAATQGVSGYENEGLVHQLEEELHKYEAVPPKKDTACTVTETTEATEEVLGLLVSLPVLVHACAEAQALSDKARDWVSADRATLRQARVALVDSVAEHLGAQLSTLSTHKVQPLLTLYEVASTQRETLSTAGLQRQVDVALKSLVMCVGVQPMSELGLSPCTLLLNILADENTGQSLRLGAPSLANGVDVLIAAQRAHSCPCGQCGS